MPKLFPFALAGLLLAAPLAFAHDPPGTPKNFCEDSGAGDFAVHDYAEGASTFAMDGNVAGDCNGDTVPADYDGHMEYALGGAWLLVEDGDGVTSGTIACYGEDGHHPYFGPISVEDVVFGSTQPFYVGADTISLVPPTDPAEPQCGDFQDDQTSLCGASPCTVTFPPGIDGAYHVYHCFWMNLNGHWILICVLGHIIS